MHSPWGRGEGVRVKTRVNRRPLIGSGSEANFNIYFCFEAVLETLTKTNRVLFDATVSALTYYRRAYFPALADVLSNVRSHIRKFLYLENPCRELQ